MTNGTAVTLVSADPHTRRQLSGVHFCWALESGYRSSNRYHVLGLPWLSVRIKAKESIITTGLSAPGTGFKNEFSVIAETFLRTPGLPFASMWGTVTYYFSLSLPASVLSSAGRPARSEGGDRAVFPACSGGGQHVVEHDHPVQQAIEMQARAVAIAQMPRRVLTTGAHGIPVVDHECQGARVVVQHQSCDNCLSMEDLGCYCIGDDLMVLKTGAGKCE